VPWREKAGRSGEGSRDTAQRPPDPDTAAAVPDGEGSGEVGVGSRRLKVPRGLGNFAASSVRNNTAALVPYTGFKWSPLTPRAPSFVLSKTVVSTGLADALQCPPEEVRMGSSARSPAAPAAPHPRPPGCPVLPLRAGTHTQAATQLLPTLPRSHSQPRSRRGALCHGWDSASRSRPHLRISTHALTRARRSPLQSWQRLPINGLSSTSEAAPRPGLDPSGCSKTFVLVTIAHPSALIAAAITPTSIQDLKRATKHKGKVLGGEACRGYFQAICSCICQNCCNRDKKQGERKA